MKGTLRASQEESVHCTISGKYVQWRKTTINEWYCERVSQGTAKMSLKQVMEELRPHQLDLATCCQSAEATSHAMGAKFGSSGGPSLCTRGAHVYL